MRKQINKVREFHEAFGVHSQDSVMNPPENVRELRKSLMSEETREVNEAIDKGDLKEVAKELADLLYVTYGTILAYGLQDHMKNVFKRVHKSNMSKLGPDGRPMYRADGKVVKGPDYQPAEIEL